MKTVLAPTDFSDAAGNAVEYAVEIAKLCKAKLFLFNAYTLPITPPELGVVSTAVDEERNIMNGLMKIAKAIQKKHGNELVIDCVCRYGSPVEEINRFAEEKNMDLIVMGMEGGGYLTEKIIGSTTTSLIKKAHCPVLSIARNIKYKSIKKIALASDYEKMKSASIVNSLKELTELFQSKLYIINVISATQAVFSPQKEVGAMKLEQMLLNFDHSSYHIENDDVVAGINDFVEEKSIDMVIMIPHKHNMLHCLFNESHTKSMAFHSKVPLLTLHE